MVDSEAHVALAEASRRLKADVEAAIADVALLATTYRTLVEQADGMLADALARCAAGSSI